MRSQGAPLLRMLLPFPRCGRLRESFPASHSIFFMANPEQWRKVSCINLDFQST
jgi:hypothetical protein